MVNFWSRPAAVTTLARFLCHHSKPCIYNPHLFTVSDTWPLGMVLNALFDSINKMYILSKYTCLLDNLFVHKHTVTYIPFS